MNLTFFKRLKLCFEILTIRSGHKHPAQEKQLSTFIKGYHAGVLDRDLDLETRDVDRITIHKNKNQEYIALVFTKGNFDQEVRLSYVEFDMLNEMINKLIENGF